MRICLLVEAASGGTGRHVLDLARALTSRGHEVTLVYSPLRADTGFGDAAAESGARVATIEISRAVGIGDLVAARALTRLISEQGPFAVVHAHSSKAGAVARLAGVGGAKRVYTPHALATLDPFRGSAARSLIGLAERLLGKRTDALIAVSAAEWVEAGRLGIKPERRHLIANRLQGASFRPRSAARRALGALPTNICVGFIGRLTRQKGPLAFVAAAVAAMRREPAVRALILGDGEQAGLVSEAIADSGFSDRFSWHCNEDARDWLSALDLMVMTSSFEGLPYALLEALAAGIPVLSTPVGGAREWLTSGAGIVAEPGRLPAALIALVSNRVRLEQLRAAAKRLGSRCADKEMIDHTEALYHRLVAA